MSGKHVKVYICDGKSCKENNDSRFEFYDGPHCYMNGGECWHTTDIEHALFAKYHRIDTSYEVMEDGKTCFETVKAKDLLRILNV